MRTQYHVYFDIMFPFTCGSRTVKHMKFQPLVFT